MSDEEITEEERFKVRKAIVKLSATGLQALEEGINPDTGEPFTDRQLFILEVASRIEAVTGEHLLELTSDILRTFHGDAVAARQAIRDGHIKFEKQPKLN